MATPVVATMVPPVTSAVLVVMAFPDPVFSTLPPLINANWVEIVGFDPVEVTVPPLTVTVNALIAEAALAPTLPELTFTSAFGA